jgi:hypothetical protein
MEKPWKVNLAFVGEFIAGSVFGGLLALRISRYDRQQVRMAAETPAPVTTLPATGPAVQTPPTTPGTTVAGTPVTAPAQLNPNAPKPNPPPQLQLPPSMAVQAPQLMRRYVARLELTAEQKERIHPLIERAAKDLGRQQQTNLRETGFIIAHLQEDLAKELTPEQRGRLEEMAENQRKVIEQREKAQQDKVKPLQGGAQKLLPKDPAKGKPPTGKPADDGN